MTPRRRGRRAPLSESALAVAVAVAVAVLVKAFVAQAFYIPSASMEPQLDVHDRVVVSRLAYDLHSPRRGDIVVFEAPAGVEKEPTIPTNPVLRVLHGAAVAIGLASARTDLIKRVIALPGETVAGRHGHVYIDGRVLMEPYLPPGTLTSDFGPVQVPRGHVWVMGDNRSDSEDSRVFGPIPESAIVGRAVWRVWPPDRLAFL